MDKGIMSIKMSGELIAVLAHLYDGLWANYEPVNAHEELLYGHISEMRDKLMRMVDKDQASYKLSFGGTEMLAFVQLWEKGGRPLNPTPAMIVQTIFNKLDQKVKHQRYVG